MRRALALSVVLAAATAAPASADEPLCRSLALEFTPADYVDQPTLNTAPQIVAWLETSTGTYVDTVFITDAVGRYGIGNRPGRFDFSSGALFPYGRRITTFPVWAERHGHVFPDVVFQDGHEENLSHDQDLCSPDTYFCAPRLLEDDRTDWDAMTCATVAFTDKGVLGTASSKYPPRSDVIRGPKDPASVDMYEGMNVFDAVSHATPPEGVPAQVRWPIPDTLPMGDYVLWMEVSREFDQNATYSVAAFPSPVGIPYGKYGEPYRGQPSVLYRVAFSVGATDSEASVLDYIGYGDPDGLDGNVRAPDSTITTGVSGSGAERLAVMAGAPPYRLRVAAHTARDPAAPAAPFDLEAIDVTSSTASIVFAAPGDDGLDGQAASYEVRLLAGGVLTDATFTDGAVVANVPAPDASGLTQQLDLDRLLFDTPYSIGIRAVDDCGKVGPLAVASFTTAARSVGEVDACFIATAAYGSVLAADVGMLRHFRDRVLAHSVLGQLVIQSYYTFGPAVAGVIAESDPLRELTRALLAPIVDRVRALR